MGRVSVIFAFLVFGVGLFASAEDYIDIDSISTAKSSVVGEASTSGSDGDDDDDGSSMLSDEGSASGSGETTTDGGVTTPEATTVKSTTAGNVDVIVFDSQSTTKATESPESTTKAPNKGDPSEEKTTEKEEPKSTEKPESSEEPNVDPNDGVDAMARTDPEEKVLRVLTTEVIAAVVVGAVCAVILIAFLVYRLRKRDEGSYPLTDSSYKDTYKLARGDTGKEAFV